MTDGNPRARPLTPEQLKAFAHPLRMRLYRLLHDQGRATASTLARETGESSGQTSYHLRQLERFGFVEELPGVGTGRERWWGPLSFSYEDGSELVDPEVWQALGEWTVEGVAGDLRRAAARTEDDPEWVRAGTLTSHTQWMTREELAALTEELLAVLRRHGEAAEERHTAAGATRGAPSRPGERRVRVHLHTLSLPEEGSATS